MPVDHFGEAVAARYDAAAADMFDPDVVEPAVEFLADLAKGGPALEFGIGTGRIALPLARRGIRVYGIDLSEAMVARLRQKPGADEIAVTIGDFGTTRLEEEHFSLVYLVFNTLGNLTSQDAQVACFENASAHLAPGGCFVVEIGIPSYRRLPPGESQRVFAASDEHWGVDEFDVANQLLVSHHFNLVDGRYELHSLPFRSVWPSELDLMARIADMELRERWDDWSREPFTSESTRHVSVWAKR